MKKLFVLFLTLFTSAILFFSCDPHAEGNTVTINIDAEAIKSIFNNNRAADSTNYKDAYLYARLIGSEGTIYEKTAFFTWPESSFMNSEDNFSSQLTFTGVTYRETYNLYVYVVHGGKSVAFGSPEPFVLNRFGPTREHVDLYVQEAPDIFEPDFRCYPPSNQDSNGNYIVTIDEDKYKVTNQAVINFQTGEYEEVDTCIFDFYILHNGKQINLDVPLKVDSSPDPDGNTFIRYDFTYTFKEEGDYIVACRKTNPNSHLFATTYHTVKLRSNKIDTNYVIYDNTSGRKVWLMDSIQDTTSLEPDFTDSSSNFYDFCWDSDMNFYSTNGTSIYKNNITSSAIGNSGGKTIFNLSSDIKSNLIIAQATSDQVGIFDLETKNFNWIYPSDFGNTLMNVAAWDKAAYLIYDYTYTNMEETGQYNYIDILAFKHNIIANSTGHTINDSYDETYKLFTIKYPFSYDGSTFISFNVQDAICYQNNLYVLCNVPSQKSDLQYFGFIAKLDLSTKKVSIIGQNNISNKNNTDSKYSNLNYYDFGLGKGYLSDDKSKILIAPQRFIAIKPKKLIVSDDGFVYEWLYGDTYNYKNSNRAITIDLDSFSITNIQKLNNITWNVERTDDFGIMGCGVFNYSPN